MNDSREFQGVESNYSGKLSYVPSQPTVIPSPRSKLSCDERLPLDTWNTSGLQENVFGDQFSTFDSPRDHHQGIHSCASQRERGSVQQARRSGTPFTRDDKQSKNQIPMSTFASSPSTVSSIGGISAEFMVVPQRQQISEPQFDKFPAPQSYLVWKYDSKIKRLPVLIFHRTLCCGSKKWRWLSLWMN